MSPETSIPGDLTRHLLARARERDDDPAAARRACDWVSAEFSRWVGVRGYEAIFARALAETRPAYPALGQIRYQVTPEQSVAGVGESVGAHGADATAQALAALLESILAICTRLVGGDIVATLVEKTMESSARDNHRRGDNLDQRSARS